MAKFIWHEGGFPHDMEIRQVYGVIFSHDGRVLLIEDNGKYSLIGGHPEVSDGGIEGTLHREVLEEVNITVKNPVLIGYQELDEENGSHVYAQVRMAALIDYVGKKRPDSDNGKTYARLLVPPARAIELLGWGDMGYKQVTAACAVAEKMYGLSCTSAEEEYI